MDAPARCEAGCYTLKIQMFLNPETEKSTLIDNLLSSPKFNPLVNGVDSVNK